METPDNLLRFPLNFRTELQNKNRRINDRLAPFAKKAEDIGNLGVKTFYSGLYIMGGGFAMRALIGLFPESFPKGLKNPDLSYFIEFPFLIAFVTLTLVGVHLAQHGSTPLERVAHAKDKSKNNNCLYYRTVASLVKQKIREKTVIYTKKAVFLGQPFLAYLHRSTTTLGVYHKRYDMEIFSEYNKWNSEEG